MKRGLSGRQDRNPVEPSSYQAEGQPEDLINQIICGDCLEVTKQMPNEFIDMCITSPPYWGLRDYGTSQIFGGNADCEHEWGSKIIQDQRRKIAGKNTHVAGTKVNMGNFCLLCHAWKGQLGLEPTPELYIEHMTAVFHEVKRVLKKTGTLWLNMGDTYSGSNTGHTGPAQTKWQSVPRGSGKSLQSNIDLPSKCLCMIPERLAWALIQDGWILRNKIIWYKTNGMPSSVKDRFSNKWEYLFLFSKSKQYYFDLDAVREKGQEDSYRKSKRSKDPWSEHNQGVDGYYHQALCRGQSEGVNPLGKNPGDVFSISTQPFPEAHFAVFPEKLCEKPIKAGCPEGGIVLDPFCGAGTACFMAKEMGRRYIGIDIKPEYIKLSKKRLAQGVL